MESDNSMTCPDCGGRAVFEIVDVGVGMQQVGPANCGCGWIEPCPHVARCMLDKCTSFSYCKQGVNEQIDVMERSTAVGLADIKDDIGKGAFGRVPSECLSKGICVSCGKPATKFKDALSMKEYQISVFCQECQDTVFG